MKLNPLYCLASFLIILNTAHAGIVVGGTRVIYDASKKEASLNLNNPDGNPYLIQSWIENPEGMNKTVPFVITPPLFRLDGNQQNVLRIVQTGNLAKDQESLYWLNVKSIPSTAKVVNQNSLQIAVKTRIKLIYRPTALKGNSAEHEAGRLTWQRDGDKIKVTNPSNYYMNFGYIKLNGVELNNVTYAAPHASAAFLLPTSATSGHLSFALISDYGAIGEAHTALF